MTARRGLIALAVLLPLVLVSALAAVYAKHLSRKHFVELQALIAERDRLEIEWGRLQIEESTLSSHAEVERIARTQLGMRTPDPRDIHLAGGR